MLVEPNVFDEVTYLIPGMVMNCFSRGVATVFAIISGFDPGKGTLTVIVGKLTSGRLLTGKR